MTEDPILRLILTFLKLGILSVGGFDAVVSEIQREIVLQGWVSEAEFGRLYALSRVLPGSVSYATVPVGYTVAGVHGAVLAFLAFNIPTIAATLAFMAVWKDVRNNRWPRAFRTAITPIALGLTLASAYVLGRSSINDAPTLLIAAVTILLIQRSHVPIPLIPPAAGAIGVILGQFR